MKILIIYDTVHGNTKQVAEAIGEGFGSDNGVQVVQADHPDANSLSGIDLLIIGSPTHGGWYTEAIKSFINAHPADALKNLKAAAFDTSSTKVEKSAFVKFIINFFGNAAPRIAKTLRNKGANVIASASFLVMDMEGPLQDGELDRAKSWADDLIR